jgi:D-beta-D-heptose 7-phosphate kinase/D-beta-D-heptose 1-phosphate adenosyltransferase
MIRAAIALEELKNQLLVWRQEGKKIVFTNGVFDILHLGHATYLEAAASYGDILIVGINSDSSVKRLNKGPERPIHIAEDRARLLTALRSVSAVIIFDDDTPLELIQHVQPDVLVKGGDYDAEDADAVSPKYIVGSAEVKQSGGRVVTIPLVAGHSTTKILQSKVGG